MSLTFHTWEGSASGPALVVLGAVHGNEVCGALALRQLQQELLQGRWPLQRGRLTLVPVANPLAWSLRTRDGERNLNRGFALQTVCSTQEDRVVAELAPLLARHDVLLDLHSFSSHGPAFAMVGPPKATAREPLVRADAELALAQRLGVSHIVQGWLDVYDHMQRQRGLPVDELGKGTNEWMREQGGLAITLECGQHDELAAVGRAHAATLALMHELGLLAPSDALVHATLGRMVAAVAACGSVPASPPVLPVRLSHVWLREALGDRLLYPWQPFSPVVAGTPLLSRADGRLELAPCDGQVLFPNPLAELSEELLYFAH